MSVLNKDVLSGALFMLVGGAGLWLGNDYAMGTAFRMGPGYFPRVLCGMLVAIGFVVAVKGAIAGAEPVEGLHWWPMILITLAVLAFAGLISTLGLLPAAAAVVLLGAIGGPEFKIGEGLMLAVLLSAAAIGIFKYGLNMTMPILDLSILGISGMRL